MKRSIFQSLKLNRSLVVYLSFVFLFICDSIILSAHNKFDNSTQSVDIEAEHIVLASTENNAQVSVSLDSDQLDITSITFSVIFDNEVLQPTGVNISGGAFNLISDNELRIALFSINPELASISFNFISGPGTLSPIDISIINIFDINDNEVSSLTNVINGSISKSCVANAIFGCTNDDYVEYNPSANCDDGSCATLLCPFDLYISGMPVMPGIYTAENDISSDGLLNQGIVEYSSGNSTELISGFEVIQGVEYIVTIEGCL